MQDTFWYIYEKIINAEQFPHSSVKEIQIIKLFHLKESVMLSQKVGMSSK